MKQELASEIIALVRRELPENPFVRAVWVSAETEDANLSQVRVPWVGDVDGTDLVRWVPKASHVTGLTAGQTVICIRNPLTIIGIQVGDISLVPTITF